MNSKTPVEKHFDEIASKYDFYTKRRDLHYSTLKKLLGSLIPKGKRVFEVGCGTVIPSMQIIQSSEENETTLK